VKSTNRKIIALQLILFFNLTCLAQTSSNISPYVQLKPISVTDINFTKGFWANYQEALKTGAIESVWQSLNDSLNSTGFSNFFIAAGLQKGKSHNTNWSDGDCYKWI
jgi:DUF1680 family protein